MTELDIVDGQLRLAVLGPVRIWRDGQEFQTGAPQVRALLALLLVQVGRPVTLGEIVDVLWGQDPPATAVNAVHGHVGTLRRLLEPSIGQRERGRWLVRSTGGYQLAGTEGSIDLLRFRRLIHDARTEVAAGRDEQALARFAEGLSLWQGRCAGNVDPTVRAHPAFRELDRECAAAAREAADCALRAGRPLPVLSTLRQAADLEPLDEPLQARLMLLLAADGQQSQALAVFGRVRAALADELGIDPCAELRDAHAAVLRRSAEGAPARVADRPAATATPPAIRPAQLPPDLSSFTGRRGELKRAMSLLPAQGAPARTVVISAISGMAGIGKTTTAVHWAHQVAGQYPDGQLYVNLRGFDPGGVVTPPTDALRRFLEAFGVAAERIPHGVDAQSALYRSMLAGRRVLVVLDNARDAEQVRPLLPGSSGCLAVVTSRNHLSGLVATDGALPIVLDVLPESDARKLFAQRLDAVRLAAQPQAVDGILARCAGLPLALAIVAARAAVHPALPLSVIAAELYETAGSLDAFADDDSAVDARAVFSWSYRTLSAEAARMFRLLGSSVAGVDVSLPAAASICGAPLRDARGLCAELHRAGLIVQHVPGRFGMHDLLATYARELAAELDSAAERAAAKRGLFDHYLHSAAPAVRKLYATTVALDTPPVAGALIEAHIADDRALAWLTMEWPAIVAAAKAELSGDSPDRALPLIIAINSFLEMRGHRHEALALLEAAEAAFKPAVDDHGRATVCRLLGLLYVHIGRMDAARVMLAEAGEIYRRLDDGLGQALNHRYLAALYETEHRHDESLASVHASLRHYRACGHRTGEAYMMNALGVCHVAGGRPRQAITECEKALGIFGELGEARGQAATRDTLGSAYHQLGELGAAITQFEIAVQFRADIGDRAYEAGSLDRLGDCLHDAGREAEAMDAWQRALTAMIEVSHRDTEHLRAKIARVGPARR